MSGPVRAQALAAARPLRSDPSCRRWSAQPLRSARSTGDRAEFAAGDRSQLPLSGAIFLIEQLAGQEALDRAHADDLRATLTGVRNGEASDYAAGESATNESAVAFAVLRRISRESVHIADPIERVARELAAALAAVHADRGPVTLDEIDLTDRLSLKLYTRLFLRLDHQYPNVSWQWRFATDVATSPGTLLSTRARHLLFERIAGVLQPASDLGGGLPPHDGGGGAGPSTVLDLSTLRVNLR